MENKGNRPKIGLALSGGSGRAIAHIGVLEIFQEQKIPIDFIAACSSGTIVAASYACATMDNLKTTLLHLDHMSLLGLVALEKDDSGMFSLEKFEEKLKEFTLGKHFEEVRPMLSFIACDLQTGEPVSLNLGDLARASRISSSVPGLFSPTRWGNRLLVDGGLFSVVPTNEVRKMGADIVIGVDIAASRHIITKRYSRVWHGYNYLKKSLPVRIIGQMVDLVDKIYDKTMDVVFYNQSDYYAQHQAKDLDLLSVFARAMEIIAEKQKQGAVQLPSCDIMLAPDVKKYGPLSVGDAVTMLEEGRKVARQAMPEIRQLIEEFQRQKVRV